jgi:8-oxo-dGTP pyrophosphatase MutT (NUDIX family)
MDNEVIKRGPFLVVGSKIKYSNPWIRVREDKVIRPDGEKGIFGVMSTKGSVHVLPIEDSGLVYLIREYRYAIDRYSLEVPAGGIEEGESVEEAAYRELKEETGLRAKRLINLGYADPGTTEINAPGHMIVAMNLRQGLYNREAGEEIKIMHIPFEEAVQRVMSSEVTHAASAVLILKAWQLWKAGELVQE